MSKYSNLSQAELIELLEMRDETARSQHFDDMAKRCADDLDFADAYERDAMERGPDLPEMMI